MKVSAARLEANRRNAAKSTGPRTAEGKLASRGNALTHGMTATVVMIDGDDAEVARRSEALEAELCPSSELGQLLVRRVALLSVRMERCASHESAALSARVRHAFDDFDDRRSAEVEAAFANLPADPPAEHRRLCRMPEGVDRLVAAWQSLAAELDQPDPARWDAARAQQVDALLGRSHAEPSPSRASMLALAIGDPSGEDAAAARSRCRTELLALIGRELARLREHRRSLDLGAIAADRASAPALALFDSSKEAAQARKYEAAAERGMYRALREFRQFEAEPETPSGPHPAAEPRPGLGSFSNEPDRPIIRTPPRVEPARAAVAPPKNPPRLPSEEADRSNFVGISIGKPGPGPG